MIRMNHLTQYLGKVIFGALLFTLSAHSFAEDGGLLGARFVAGTHYEVLDIPVATEDKDKIEVVELFSYACIHCKNFDPYVKDWQAQQPEDVNFRLVPAIFNADWEKLAQAFYTAETLGVTAEVHDRMFEGIHNRQEDLRQPTLLAPIYAELGGVSEADFGAAYSSFSVRSRVQQAKALVRAYKVMSVPSIIVNGKYRIDGRMAGGNAAMLEVVDFLVAKERTASVGAR